MPPQAPCPNCGQSEWLESPTLHHMQRLDKTDAGYEADASMGINLRVWRCNNCMYVMAFWEPD